MSTGSVNINKPHTKTRVLVAPLDWGLGHATRCIPVINAFLRNDCTVIFGGEGPVAALLQKEFPGLEILPLSGYNVSYSKRKVFFFLKMLVQVPKIKRIIKEEHNWLNHTIEKHHIDLVISDNRYGLWSSRVACIFITHQLFIKTGNWFTERFAQRINYNYIKKFTECWVPDFSGNENLAGALSHPPGLPAVATRYIGALSRFEKQPAEKNIDLLILLSGPEPQRTIFENILLPQIEVLTGNTVMVRGLPLSNNNLVLKNKHAKIFNHLPAGELNNHVLSSKMIIARSGYSTVMDLAALQQKAILVATPGQAEQEYLAAYLAEKNYCISASQKGFEIGKVLKTAANKTFVSYPENEEDMLQANISAMLQKTR